MFSKIRHNSTLRTRAVKMLSEAILLGKMKPGERLNESEIARKLSISRAPIREALRQLEEQGLIINVPRRGMFVVSLKDEQVQKINSLRILLEGEALRLARKRMTEIDRRKLEDLLERIDRSRSVPTDQSVRLDMEFHRLIWSLSGNEYLERILISLTAPLFAHSMLVYLREDKQRITLDSHRPIAQFLFADSGQTAEEVMLAHLSVRWVDPIRFSSFSIANPVPAHAARQDTA